ncbi:hypothetical protein MMC20_005456 [Loxospora ochrophaea]|nr:hypothetical protein [Loxospora ochrophaea]
MFVQANPSRAKSTEEKEERAKRYKPGDNVTRPVRHVQDNQDDESDRRMMEEIRDLSLREVGVRGPRSYERGVRHRARSPESRDEETRHRRRHGEERARRHNEELPVNSRGQITSRSADSRPQARHVEHQSSLRSLLSNSDSAEMEEEILRQIMDEGLLDDIDLHSLDGSQEDDLSERIAEAYRRRHQHSTRLRSEDNHSEESRGSGSRARQETEDRSGRRHHIRTSSAANQPSHPSHPPVSRPHLLEAYPTGQGHRRRTSSESRRRTSPSPASSFSPRLPSNVPRQASRSATDLSNRPHISQSSQTRPIGLSDHGRRTTDPQPRRLSDNRRRDSTPVTAQTEHVNGTPGNATLSSSSRTTASSDSSEQNSSSRVISRQRLSNPLDIPRSTARQSASPPSTVHRAHPRLYAEPSVSCDRCGKQNIQYELHESCLICREGHFNLCHRCYLLGRGCLNWFGFGVSAMQHYKRREPLNGYPPDQALPHILTHRRYTGPSRESIQQTSSSESRRMTAEDPAKRLQKGAFCSNCLAAANECYWKCDVCNEGEWGFCDRCVNQGKCCTHPLLPITQVAFSGANDSNTSNSRNSDFSSTPMASPTSMSELQSPQSAQYTYLSSASSVSCDICKYPIQPSNTRFHCPQCNEGDYNVCIECYLKQVATGAISGENGDKGWRRCLKGHRMVVVGFEDSLEGLRRIVVKDLVGGHALKDELEGASGNHEWSWHKGNEKQVRAVSNQVAASTGLAEASQVPLLQNYPPNGGVGIRALAQWSWWPGEGVTDELAFPKGAEIREAEDINRDWFWGCYAGKKGVFPGQYVKVLGVVTM